MIYEVLEEIGQGGLCSIFRIRKRDEMIGGSKRKLDGNPFRKLKPEGFVRRKEAVEKELRSQDKEVLFALKVINLSLVQVSLCVISNIKQFFVAHVSLDKGKQN